MSRTLGNFNDSTVPAWLARHCHSIPSAMIRSMTPMLLLGLPGPYLVGMPLIRSHSPNDRDCFSPLHERQATKTLSISSLPPEANGITWSIESARLSQ